MLVLKCHGDWAPGQRFVVRSVYQNEALGTGLSWTPMGIEVSSSNSDLSRGQRPTALLCTLHSLAYPRTTQHSVPAAGTFLPGRIASRPGPAKEFPFPTGGFSSFQALPDAHFPNWATTKCRQKENEERRSHISLLFSKKGGRAFSSTLQGVLVYCFGGSPAFW
jgi:hypothetical protein